MKKSLLLLFVASMTFGMGYAQKMDDVVFQPTHVVGRSFNESGVVTRELVSDFSYLEDGKLSHYDFPEYAITANYTYSGDYINQENIFHQGGHPLFSETNLFTYENGQVKTISHLMSQMGVSQYWVFSYYDDGRLERKDQREDDEDFHMHWLYEYENDGKTVIESYYTSWVSQGMLLRKRTTSTYDDNYVLLTEFIENYNEGGDLTSTSQIRYGYTPGGLLEDSYTQVLIDGVWVNDRITHYTYDNADGLVEQLDGVWDADNNEWDYTKKITFDTSEDGQTYTVSFYKKVDGEWVWDVFDYQTVLFGSHLQAQQRMLGYMVYEDMNGYGNVNQFEFTMSYTTEPIYLYVDEVEGNEVCFVHPNPTTGLVTVKGENLQQVEVINMLGQQVLSVRGSGNEMQINMSNLPAGIYFVAVTNEEGRKCVQKVVRE